MKLKKINAALGLLTILFMLLHIGFSVYSYLTMYYNPFLKMIFAIPFIVLVCLHAVCGMMTVFMQKDGSSLNLYPKKNLRTILQRLSAALIFPLLILHINTFTLMSKCAAGGHTFFIILLIIAEILFFGVVITHISVSFTNGLVTLGILTSESVRNKMDTVIFILNGIIFVISVYAVVKGQVIMFLH